MNELNPPLILPSTKKSRLPRYQRVKHPPIMVLTNRDRDILRQVYHFRLMTREQIEHLLFAPSRGQDHLTKTSKVRQRLKLLYQHGYLERIPFPTGPGQWAWRPIYRLARKGANLLAEEMNIPMRQLQYWGRGDDHDHRTSAPSLLFMKHSMEINDVRIAVQQAASAHGCRVEQWLDDTTLKREKMKEDAGFRSDWDGDAKVGVIPDAYFVLHLGDRRAHFFLELDRATMSNGRWRARILSYLDYVRSGRYRERFQTNSLRILTVTTTPQRLENLKKATEQAGGKDLFWFTTLDQVSPTNVFFRPIWQLANDDPRGDRKCLLV